MKILSAILLLLSIRSIGVSQQLYSKSFGNPNDQPVIFLHGGPGSSSVYFESTTANLLAARGFFVIVYDRRGEGRSKDENARMNFNEAFTDLEGIYEKYNLKSAHLLAFSFGGLVAAQYAQKHPDMVKSLVMCSSLVSQQQSYNTILASTKAIYGRERDSLNLNELNSIMQMDTNSLNYRTLVFKHASANGFFTLQAPNERAREIYDTYKTDSLIIHYTKNENAVSTFWHREVKHNIDITPELHYLRQRGIPIYALYGKQDGLFSSKQISNIKQVIGDKNVAYLDNCSHIVFIDQQLLFLSTVQTWLCRAD
ncbi:alpha/beta hydrolase [Dyadobacter sp. MSC1_007]|jgi:proline iminopeptidase|uniref:alpha/beta hydrolase n=1 Tax=Dyadobacter sp. MSC1_007 TaxID=2909264 RepID=UPI002030867B|nr:alpha/beta hydrolase [Dyadobacter sp. MSC1_007]